MKIGELAQLTGITTRQLRYYEEQGLLAPNRTFNNYRDYDQSAVDTVRQIRLLVESGIPTRVVRSMLPCVHGPGAEMPHHDDPELADLLVTERDRLDQAIERLVRSRSQVECYLDRVAPNRTSPEFRRKHPVPGQATSTAETPSISTNTPGCCCGRHRYGRLALNQVAHITGQVTPWSTVTAALYA